MSPLAVSVSNARGVLLAFSRRSGEFVRTPKHDLRGTRGGWRLKDYRAPRSLCVNALEVLLGVYFTGAALYAALAGMAASLPVLVLFQMGFFYRSALQRRSSWPP